MMGDSFPAVETPPWEQRFEWTQGHKVRCVMCGISGHKPMSEQDEEGCTKWWTITHREHVMCTCGKVVTKKGIGTHLGAMKRHGKPCPLRK